MVMTRRASMLERQRSESVLASSDEPNVDIKPDITSIDMASPSLVRPTPEFTGLAILMGEVDVVQAMSSITIKDEPVDLESQPDPTPTPLKLESSSEIDLTPDITSSSSTAFNIDLASPPPVAVKNEPIEFESEDEDDEEARDTVGALRTIKPLPVRVKRESSGGSVVSIEDAKASIDDIMIDREAFTADEDNKLRFWQSLCIEFRLVRIEGDPIPSFDQLTLGTRSIVPAQSWSDQSDLPPIPTSCTEANKLLKAKAHANLVDYFAARDLPVAQGEEKDYTPLLFPTRQAVVEYTRKHKKFVDKDLAKEGLLQPLLVTMRNQKRR